MAQPGSSQAPRTEKIKIGLWGGPGSGKTHYAIMLYQDIRGRRGFRIEEVVGESYKSLLDTKDKGEESRQQTEDEESEQKNDSASRKSSAEDKAGTYESSTPGSSSAEESTEGADDDEPGESAADKGDWFARKKQWLRRTRPEQMKTYKFRIYRERKSVLKLFRQQVADCIELEFTDAAGEWYRHPRQALESHGSKYKDKDTNPLRFLAECDGIICLFDSEVAIKGIIGKESSDDSGKQHKKITPQDRPLTREELPGAFRELCRLLRDYNPPSEGKLVQPIAICLTKADRPGLWERRDNPDELKKWARQHLPGLVEEVENACDEKRTFWVGISVLGVAERDGEKIWPTDDQNKIRPEAQIMPCNLFKPVEWLISVLMDKKESD